MYKNSLKYISALLALGCVLLSFPSCSGKGNADTEGITEMFGRPDEKMPPDGMGGMPDMPQGGFEQSVDTNMNNWESEQETKAPDTESDAPYVPYEGEGEEIILNETSISYSGSSATVAGSKITINKPGEYVISGRLNDGQIIVELTKDEQATLILNNADITCASSAPIYIKSADRVTIELYAQSKNKLTDGKSYIYENETDNEPNAALFSKDDLTIKGGGSLEVTANYNNGITSKNDLKIKNGNITVTSAHDGLRGKDSIEITGGKITVNATGDGLKTTNTEDSTKGYVVFEDATLNITAGEDGIQAESYCTINSGNISIKTGNGSSSSWAPTSSEASAKGIKAASLLNLNGGEINIEANDDSIHSNGTINIHGGKYTLSSGDDGIHADTCVNIENGVINISRSYEGIEGTEVNISGGTIQLIASDDGINCAGGNDGSSFGRPGAGSFSSSNAKLNISGGRIYVNASGDGLDSNGTIEMSGGTVIVDGPTSNGDGALDYDGSFTISGGILIASGSSGMAQSVSSTSTQNTVMCYVSGSAGQLFNISDSNGKSVITYSPSKAYQCVLVSTSALKTGQSYTVSTGGQCDGQSINGLYEGGTYTSGEARETYTHSQTVMSVGSGGGFGGGGFGGGGHGGGFGGGERPQKPGRL